VAWEMVGSPGDPHRVTSARHGWRRRHSRENRGAGGAVCWSPCLLFLTNNVLSSALDAPAFSTTNIPCFFSGRYASRTQDPGTAIRFTKAGILIFPAHCVATVMAPQAHDRAHYRACSGVSIRFWGWIPSHSSRASCFGVSAARIHRLRRRWRRPGNAPGWRVGAGESRRRGLRRRIAVPVLVQRSRNGAGGFFDAGARRLVGVAVAAAALGSPVEQILERAGQDATESTSGCHLVPGAPEWLAIPCSATASRCGMTHTDANRAQSCSLCSTISLQS